MTITAGYPTEIRQHPWLLQSPAEAAVTLHWQPISPASQAPGTSALLSWQLRHQANTPTMPEQLLDCLARALCALGTLQFVTSPLALLETVETAEGWKRMFASLFGGEAPVAPSDWASTPDSRYRLLSVPGQSELLRVLVQTRSPRVATAAFWQVGRDFLDSRTILVATCPPSAPGSDAPQEPQGPIEDPAHDSAGSLHYIRNQLTVTYTSDECWVHIQALTPDVLDHFRRTLTDACVSTGIDLNSAN